ncbi:hypothetical protein HK099_000515 [Clydaea vesicula]|uniref:Uncharacterized protein n=1 Tax=Clydaea vesicula TaxID=447962 RepID=A0AAD5XXJ0_9FUNG|nr:hypothetical protein HK099_000515 [Clydaea vesicula]
MNEENLINTMATPVSKSDKEVEQTENFDETQPCLIQIPSNIEAVTAECNSDITESNLPDHTQLQTEAPVSDTIQIDNKNTTIEDQTTESLEKIETNYMVVGQESIIDHQISLVTNYPLENSNTVTFEINENEKILAICVEETKLDNVLSSTDVSKEEFFLDNNDTSTEIASAFSSDKKLDENFNNFQENTTEENQNKIEIIGDAIISTKETEVIQLKDDTKLENYELEKKFKNEKETETEKNISFVNKKEHETEIEKNIGIVKENEIGVEKVFCNVNVNDPKCGELAISLEKPPSEPDLSNVPELLNENRLLTSVQRETEQFLSVSVNLSSQALSSSPASNDTSTLSVRGESILLNESSSLDLDRISVLTDSRPLSEYHKESEQTEREILPLSVKTANDEVVEGTTEILQQDSLVAKENVEQLYLDDQINSYLIKVLSKETLNIVENEEAEVEKEIIEIGKKIDGVIHIIEEKKEKAMQLINHTEDREMSAATHTLDEIEQKIEAEEHYRRNSVLWKMAPFQAAEVTQPEEENLDIYNKKNQEYNDNLFKKFKISKNPLIVEEEDISLEKVEESQINTQEGGIVVLKDEDLIISEFQQNKAELAVAEAMAGTRAYIENGSPNLMGDAFQQISKLVNQNTEENEVKKVSDATNNLNNEAIVVVAKEDGNILTPMKTLNSELYNDTASSNSDITNYAVPKSSVDRKANLDLTRVINDSDTNTNTTKNSKKKKLNSCISKLKNEESRNSRKKHIKKNIPTNKSCRKHAFSMESYYYFKEDEFHADVDTVKLEKGNRVTVLTKNGLKLEVDTLKKETEFELKSILDSKIGSQLPNFGSKISALPRKETSTWFKKRYGNSNNFVSDSNQKSSNFYENKENFKSFSSSDQPLPLFRAAPPLEQSKPARRYRLVRELRARRELIFQAEMLNNSSIAPQTYLLKHLQQKVLNGCKTEGNNEKVTFRENNLSGNFDDKINEFNQPILASLATGEISQSLVPSFDKYKPSHFNYSYLGNIGQIKGEIYNNLLKKSLDKTGKTTTLPVIFNNQQLEDKCVFTVKKTIKKSKNLVKNNSDFKLDDGVSNTTSKTFPAEAKLHIKEIDFRFRQKT